MSLDILNAVMEATKAQTALQEKHEKELAEARREREVTIENFTQQIKKIHEFHLLETQELREKLDEQKEEVARLDELAAAREDASSQFQQMLTQARRDYLQTVKEIQESHTKSLSRFSTEGRMLTDMLCRAQQQELMGEVKFVRAQTAARETGYRAHIALLATGERATLIHRATRSSLTRREQALTQAGVQIESLERALASEKSTRETSVKLQRQRAEALEAALNSEQERSTKFQSEKENLEKVVAKQDLVIRELHDQVTSSLSTFKSGLEEANADRDSALNQCNMKQQLVEEYSRTLDVQQQHLSKKDAEITHMRSLVAVEAEKASALENKMKALEAEVEKWQQTAARHKKELNEAVTQREANKREFDADLAEKVQKLNDATSKIPLLNDSVTTLQEANKGLSLRLDTLRSEHTSMSSSLLEAQENLKIANDRGEKYELAAKEKDAMIAVLNQKLELSTSAVSTSKATTEAQLEALQRKLTLCEEKHSSEVSVWKSKVSAAETRAEVLEAQMKQLKAAFTTQQPITSTGNEGGAAVSMQMVVSHIDPNGSNISGVSSSSTSHHQHQISPQQQHRNTDSNAPATILLSDHEAILDRITNERNEAELRAEAALNELNAFVSAKDELQSLGGTKAAMQLLSLRSLEIQDLKQLIHELKEEIILLEARCVTTETRLHHSVEEGAATSILLERGMRRISASAMLENEASEIRKTLAQAARTLRNALVKEGYDVAALPLQPSETLDVPYLKQLLSDHADMCAAHFRKVSSAGGIVASAARTPLVYRGTGNTSNTTQVKGKA